MLAGPQFFASGLSVDFQERAMAISKLRALTALLMLSTAVSAAETGGGQIGAVLSNLPAKDSAAYQALFEAAGRPGGVALEMTKAEMWNIPAKSWDVFASKAKSAGVAVTKLDETSNHALGPVAAGKTMTDQQKTMMHDALSSKAAVGAITMALPAAGVEEYALTKGMHDTSPGAEQPALVLPIADGTQITARRTSISKAAGGWAWHGVVEDTGEPVTLLWWPSGKMTGTATYKNHVYAIHDMGGGMHGIVEMNPDGLPQEHATMGAEMRDKMKTNVDPLVTKGDASELMPESGERPAVPPADPKGNDTRNLEDAAPGKLALAVANVSQATIVPPATVRPAAPITIRVIVAYTAAAARRYGDIETDLIALAIEEANQSFRNSGIGNVQIEVAHAYQTTYVESGSHFEHVFRIAGKNDGYMDEVHALREQYKADVGLLIVHDPNGCGLAAEVYARPERAFAVVHHECAANMYSLGHEIGHLIGARHDEALDSSVMPFAFGHGFVSGNDWRTMMSYKESCGGCMRLPVWSNPEVLVHGKPAGSASSNNARVIADNAWRVASFHLGLGRAGMGFSSGDNKPGGQQNGDK
jgi:Metallo-peptidase family M12